MDPSELLERLAQTLESLRIPYLITGSMATIAYGEPRFTNDIDRAYIERWVQRLGLAREWSSFTRE